MGSEVGTPGGRLIFHKISEDDVGALVQYGEPAQLIARLRKAELSRRLLLLRGFLDRVRAVDSETAAGVDLAWGLLEEAQQVAPDEVDEILMSPGTGIWLASALRQLHSAADTDLTPPVWASTGRLSAMAVAASVRARLTFRLDVPVQRGNVFLPGLGCAHFAGVSDAWGSAQATGHEGSLRIVCGGVEVHAFSGGSRLTSGWSPTRRLTVGRSDDRLPLVLEEHDPHRDFSPYREPRPLSDAEHDIWRSSLAQAWDILADSDPLGAEEMRCGPLLSLAPAEPQEKYRPYSSSAGEAFGGINASLPDNASQLAATLVHEFQHIKLGAVIHLEPVVTRAENRHERSELFYAPWRDDPRPIEGLIQGIYAFYGVARFWRTQRRRDRSADSLPADFEFALCREQVWSVLTSLGRHRRLTPVGRRLTQSLARQCEAWADEEVSGTGMSLAQDAIADHRARWRSHHLRPDTGAVSEAVEAWRKGMPPPAALSVPPRLVPDTRAAWLDTAATLARHRLTEPTESRWAVAAQERVGGATRADVLLALGERATARRAVLDQLQTPVPPVASWALLGRTLADVPAQREVSRFLLRFPERARAVHLGLTAAGVTRIDPVQLAAWLATGP